MVETFITEITPEELAGGIDAVEYFDQLFYDGGIITLEYNILEKTFYDQCGFPIFNIHDYITPIQARLFLENPEYTLLRGPHGFPVEIILEGDL